MMNVKPARFARVLVVLIVAAIVGGGAVAGCRVEGELDPDFDRKRDDDEQFYGSLN